VEAFLRIEQRILTWPWRASWRGREIAFDR
jgi:hypothetical protein